MSVVEKSQKLPSVLQIECPVDLIEGKHLKGVFTREELYCNKLRRKMKKDDVIKEKNDELRKKDDELRKKDDVIEELQDDQLKELQKKTD